MVPFGIDPDDLEVDTQALDGTFLERIAHSSERWVQVSSIVRSAERLIAQVRLEPVSNCGSIPIFGSEWNGGMVRLEDGQLFSCQGRGAGGAATAEALAADLFDIAVTQRAEASARIAVAV